MFLTHLVALRMGKRRVVFVKAVQLRGSLRQHLIILLNKAKNATINQRCRKRELLALHLWAITWGVYSRVMIYSALILENSNI